MNEEKDSPRVMIDKALLLGVNFAIESIDRNDVYQSIIKSGRSKEYLNGFHGGVAALYSIRDILNEEINNG